MFIEHKGDSKELGVMCGAISNVLLSTAVTHVQRHPDAPCPVFEAVKKCNIPGVTLNLRVLCAALSCAVECLASGDGRDRLLDAARAAKQMMIEEAEAELAKAGGEQAPGVH